MTTTPYPYTFAEPPARIIQIEDSVIDAARLISLARLLDANECPGALGDDNQNGWFGLKPKWFFRLTIGEATYKAIILKLSDFGGRRDNFSVVLDPLEKWEISLPAFDRGHEAYCKHTGSQLLDCLFRIDFRDAAEEVWFRADWIDTSLLRWMLQPRNLDDVRRATKDQCEAFAHRYSADEVEAMIHRELSEARERWIDPAYRVFFACQGHAFRVDRSGPELVLVPTGEKQ